jgi:hypothetical protein
VGRTIFMTLILQLCSLVLCTGRASADEGNYGVELSWELLPTCLQASNLSSAVSESLRVNRVVPEHGAARVTIAVAAESGPGYQVTFLVVDAENRVMGERQLAFANEDCDSLREHLILLTAMLVDSAHLGQPREPSTEFARAEDDAQNPLWRTTRTRAAPRAHRLSVAIGPRAEYQRLPGPALGGALSLGARMGSAVALSMDLFAFPESTLRVGDSMGASRFRWRGVSARACHGGLVPRVAFCLGFRAGEMRARGFDFSRNRVQREFLVDAELGLRFQQKVSGPIYLRADLAGFAGIRRPRFVYETEAMAFEALHAPGIFAFAGQIALGFHFL